MKKIKILTFGALLSFGSLHADIELTFENPKNFSDIEYGEYQVERGIKVHLPALEKHILKEAKRSLKEGQSLSMTITDIDLAGEYEPWRNINFQDVRIVKSIYPPRISFHFELKNSDGTVLKSGEENLVDLNFDYRLRTSYNDELFYEKEMISDWFRELKSVTK